jgi:hypothetical protein
MEKTTHRWPVRLLAIAASTLALSTQAADSTLWAASSQLPITVPAGTPMEIELTDSISTEKAKVGDPVEARLHSDLIIDNWRAVESGARVTGSVAAVRSGGNEIGGAPRLALAFTSITPPNGTSVPINVRYQNEGGSETGGDAAKIAGGAAAGAVVGHQVDDDKGAVIGGILGAAAGAAAAKNTGGDITLEKGTVLNVTAESAFNVDVNRRALTVER